MANSTTVATAYVQIMPSMEGATTNITDAILPQINGAGQSMGQTLGVGLAGSFKGVLAKMLPAAAVATVAVAAGKALGDIGEEFDAMRDAIVIGTGASGDALDSLVESAKKIGTQVPTDFETVGDVVQNLNTRLGITGQDLEDLSARVIGAGKLMGKSLNLDTLTGSLNAFGIANADAADKLDYLFGVSQATGISMDDLTRIIEANAPALKELGFDFEQSANMAGLLDKAGLDASSMMSKLSKALISVAQPGEDAAQAYRRVVGEMQDYLAAGDKAAALDIATTLFGTKGAAQFLDAIQNGTISMDQLTDATLGAGDGIMSTLEKTNDWEESWNMLQNSIKVALEPLASGVLDMISAAVKKLTQFVQDNSGAFNALGSILGNVAGVIGNVLGVALDIVTGLLNAGTTAVNVLGGAFDALVGTVSGAFDAVVSTVGGAIDQVKSFFNFEFHWPHIPLPHFSISGSINPLDWITQGVPQIGVEWYAKGGFVDGATLIGAGESGPEMILPQTGGLMDDFADSVAQRYDAALIEWLADNLGPIIAEYAPTMTRREFDRLARGAMA